MGTYQGPSSEICIGATEKLKEAPSFDGERVIVIAESPLVFEELIKRGIKINQLNIGGMGIRGERKAVARRVACDTVKPPLRICFAKEYRNYV